MHEQISAFLLYHFPLLSIIWCILIFNKHTHIPLDSYMRSSLQVLRRVFSSSLSYISLLSIVSLLPRMLSPLSYPLPGWLLFFKNLPTITSSGNLSDLDYYTPSDPSLGWVSLYSRGTCTFLNLIICHVYSIKSCMKLECKEDYFGNGEGNLETMRTKLC